MIHIFILGVIYEIFHLYLLIAKCLVYLSLRYDVFSSYPVIIILLYFLCLMPRKHFLYSLNEHAHIT